MIIIKGEEAIKRELHLSGEAAAEVLEKIPGRTDDAKASLALVSIAHSVRAIEMGFRLLVGFVTGKEV